MFSGDWEMFGEDEREQFDEAWHHSPGAQTVHLEGDWQAEAENLHPQSERSREDPGLKHEQPVLILKKLILH